MEEETFEKFGYYSNELKQYSHRKILAKCNNCGNIRELSKSYYCDLCRPCTTKRMIGKIDVKARGTYSIKRGMLEQETFEKFGYYPSQLAPRSDKRILVKCILCNKTREITKGGYYDLCNLCSRKGRHHSEETKQKMSKSHIGKYHTEETKQIMRERALNISDETRLKMSISHGGERCNFWKGGRYAQKFEESYGMERKEWRKLAKEIRKRDNYICQCCGKLPSSEVHHIYPRRLEINNHPNNLITLCKSCHSKIEHLTNKYIEQNKDPLEIFHKT